MLNVDFTFVFAAVNLLILYFFLRKFLFHRVSDFMDARSDSIAADIEKGKEDKAQGEEYKQEQEKLLQELKTERNRMMESSKKKADEHYENTVRKAQEEASRIVAAGETEVSREREKMAAELKDEVASLALAAASKVMQQNMDSDKNRGLVEEFLKDKGAA